MCPAGSVRIETEAVCRTAAAVAGKAPGANFVEIYDGFPRGCYYSTSTNQAYFNTEPVGAGKSGYILLCAAATGPTGAPLCAPGAHARARVYTSACIGTWRECRNAHACVCVACGTCT